jgi:hypothetical protein
MKTVKPGAAAIPNSKKMTVQPKNGQWYRQQYKTVPAAV